MNQTKPKATGRKATTQRADARALPYRRDMDSAKRIEALAWDAFLSAIFPKGLHQN